MFENCNIPQKDNSESDGPEEPIFVEYAEIRGKTETTDPNGNDHKCGLLSNHEIVQSNMTKSNEPKDEEN